jgi:hypothetical protein
MQRTADTVLATVAVQMQASTFNPHLVLERKRAGCAVPVCLGSFHVAAAAYFCKGCRELQQLTSVVLGWPLVHISLQQSTTAGNEQVAFDQAAGSTRPQHGAAGSRSD